MIETLKTGAGYWDPLVFLAAGLIISIIAYLIYRAGAGNYTSEMAGKPYLSGNPEISKEDSHVSGDNLYWGFVEGLREFYIVMKKMHTGIMNDYMIWYLGALAFLMLIFIGV
ncbi:hypothetical protein [Methanonatronarchaeum sp. AMET6-2]|uniref:hypothetical protein n=1 Tax=Methanonatronarchaeum sp. AMET6-2 TaxID=2933293 RepID=UPI00120DFDF0|nr:hypothetical protein [Methanonatronarchaeum sp. AMET6-2]RZN61151.1 MAG: hydrogenase [Methanonatronarchaeia archaeon]UOY09790.1 hypothetical protein MU439_05900 [Methanonatronarchaeum sp. AMET6-2]